MAERGRPMNKSQLRLMAYLLIALLFTFCQLFPSALYAGSDPVKNTEQFLEALKNKNFDVLLSLSAPQGLQLSSIRNSQPKFDIPEREANFLTKCRKDFTISYNLVMKGMTQNGDGPITISGGNDFIDNMKEEVKRDSGRQEDLRFHLRHRKVFAIPQLPMLFEKYNPTWKILEVNLDKNITRVYIELFLANKSIGIIYMDWMLSKDSGLYYVNVSGEFLVNSATHIHKISQGWPMIPIGIILQP